MNNFQDKPSYNINKFQDKPSYNINKFQDKPFRKQPIYDQKKGIELFNIIKNLNTQELLIYSQTNQVSLDTFNEDGDNLIHYILNMDNISQNTKLNIIKFLVNNNVNPNKYNKYNTTPLHLACKYQLDTIIDYLLSINVNSNIQDNLGYTPFHYILIGENKIINNNEDINIDIFNEENYDKLKKEKELMDYNILKEIKFYKDYRKYYYKFIKI
jgi:ankyrin repeat protein